MNLVFSKKEGVSTCKMSKHKEGIMGIAKETLNAEDCPSDDYNVPVKHTVQDNSKNKQTKSSQSSEFSEKDSSLKRTKSNKSLKRSNLGSKRIKNVKFDESSSYTSSFPDCWGKLVPIVVLTKIFQFVVGEDGAVPFLLRASYVCKLWREAINHPSLWRNIYITQDYNIRKKTIFKQCSKYFKFVKEIDLSGWIDLSDDFIVTIAYKCPELNSISLALCKKITFSSIKQLFEKCPKLSSLDLSYAMKVVTPRNMKVMLPEVGNRLTHLILRGTDVGNINIFINALTEYCPNLLEVDLSELITTSVYGSLNIEKLQQGCSKLRILRLVDTQFMATVPYSSMKKNSKIPFVNLGFSDLHSLVLTTYNNLIMLGRVNDEILLRFLITSHNLKVLALGGCSNITAKGLLNLPVENLEQLSLRSCSIARYPELDLVMQKWSHSLVELDLSWNTNSPEILDAALLDLISDPNSKLMILDLTGSAVSLNTVKVILNKCQYLNRLDITSCRFLPRGIKRNYLEDQLQKLKHDILNISLEES